MLLREQHCSLPIEKNLKLPKVILREVRKQNKHTKLVKFNQNPFHNLPRRSIKMLSLNFNNTLIVIFDFMGLLAPNRIKEKIVNRMTNPSTKARTSNDDEEDLLHALHLQEVLL